ncbi:MAG: hypothetical protein WBU92_01750 [Candidatus Dormiibacterota bacterium]
MRVRAIAWGAAAAGLLLASGCQGAAGSPAAAPLPPPGRAGHLTLASGAYSITVEAATLPTSQPVRATASLRPAGYSMVVTPQGSYTVRFGASPTGGAVRWTVRLSRAVAWVLDVRGGTTHLDLNLSGLHLTGLAISGGAESMVVDFPAPAGVVPVNISGGANQMSLRFGRGSAATLRLGPGVRRIVGAGPEAGNQYQVGRGGRSGDRYRIVVSSGAAEVAIGSL